MQGQHEQVATRLFDSLMDEPTSSLKDKIEILDKVTAKLKEHIAVQRKEAVERVEYLNSLLV